MRYLSQSRPPCRNTTIRSAVVAAPVTPASMSAAARRLGRSPFTVRCHTSYRRAADPPARPCLPCAEARGLPRAGGRVCQSSSDPGRRSAPRARAEALAHGSLATGPSGDALMDTLTAGTRVHRRRQCPSSHRSVDHDGTCRHLPPNRGPDGRCSCAAGRVDGEGRRCGPAPRRNAVRAPARRFTGLASSQATLLPQPLPKHRSRDGGIFGAPRSRRCEPSSGPRRSAARPPVAPSHPLATFRGVARDGHRARGTVFPGDRPFTSRYG
jgi:hypothetical protein